MALEGRARVVNSSASRIAGGASQVHELRHEESFIARAEPGAPLLLESLVVVLDRVVARRSEVLVIESCRSVLFTIAFFSVALMLRTH
jgi:hypothetical protein